MSNFETSFFDLGFPIIDNSGHLTTLGKVADVSTPLNHRSRQNVSHLLIVFYRGNTVQLPPLVVASQNLSLYLALGFGEFTVEVIWLVVSADELRVVEKEQDK